VFAGCGRRVEHLRAAAGAHLFEAIGDGTRAKAEKSLQSSSKRCKMHGETPTSHACRRVAAGQSSWFFCRYCRRGIRVFRLRDTGRRGAAARFWRCLHPRGVKIGRLDGHLELKKLVCRGVFFQRTRIRALRREYGAKPPEFTETGYY